MATVRDLLAAKGNDVFSIGPTATVLDAARLMNDRGIGGVLVIDGEQRLVGIFTERDILRRIVAADRPPSTTRLNEVLTTAVVTCQPETTVEECGAIMTSRRIRHLPVVDARGVCGVVTSGDVLAFRVSEQETTIQYMHSYIFDTR